MGDDYFLCSPLIFTAVMENFWLYIISPAFTAFLSWFFTRRTYKQEIRKMKQDNDESGYEYLKKLNDDLESILNDLPIATKVKNTIGEILMSNSSIQEKRIAVRKLSKIGLNPKYVTLFLKLLEYMAEV